MTIRRRAAPKRRQDWLTRTWPLSAALGAALAAPPTWPAALAPNPGTVATPVDLDAKATELVQRLVLDRAASLARAQRKADEREQALLDQLERKDRQLRRSLAAAQTGSSQMAKLRAELTGVTAERERLVAELTGRDRAFQAELAEYRRLVAELANSPNPERRAALERYADGDRGGAFATLKELTRIEEAAGEKAVKLRAAARHREQAALAADMKDRADPGVTTLTVLEEWEAAAERDPGHMAAWVFIARLRQEAGRSILALAAAKQASLVASSDRDRSWALTELGDALIVVGEVTAARSSYSESIEVLRQLAKRFPGMTEFQRDISVTLLQLGNANLEIGDFAAAVNNFTESLNIRRNLSNAIPADARAKRDVSVSLGRLGRAKQVGGDLRSALVLLTESLQISRNIMADRPKSSQARRDTSIALLIRHQPQPGSRHELLGP